MRWYLTCSFALLFAGALCVAGCSEPEQPSKPGKPTAAPPAESASGMDTAAKPAPQDTGAPEAPSPAEPANSANAAPVTPPPAETKPSAEKPVEATPPSPPPTTEEKKPATEEKKPVTEEKKPATEEKKMSITKAPYGKMPDGTEIDQYTLTNANGLKVKLITYGAITTAVEVPDRDGKIENVTLYCDSLEDYMAKKENGEPVVPFFGATIGRYGNRIAKGQFKLDGKEYQLPINNLPNSLHGGSKGFDKVVWSAEEVNSPDVVGVAFTYVSPDGDQGYPGKLTAKVTYTLTDKDELKMDYEATTDKDTVVNLTNHDYWNLAGAGNGDVLKHVLWIDADKYLPVDSTLIPLGKLDPVKDGPFDFTKAKAIGKDLDKVPGGYDHCYVLNRKGDDVALVASVVEPASGRKMEIYTTQPAVQFYSGNFLDGTIKAGGKSYPQHAALCLETQHYPDSPNQPDFPSTVLKPGETYRQSTVHKFSVEK